MGPILKRVSIGVGLATLAVLGVGFLLPATYSVNRSLVIKAEAAHIHTFVNDLEQWPNWSPWVKDDPTIEVVLGEITAGVGAHQTWEGSRDSGEITFTRSDPAVGIGFHMALDHGKYLSTGTIEYTLLDGGTEVIWTMNGENSGNPIDRYFFLMMDPMTGPIFEDGLNRLKLLSETTTSPAE